MSVDYKKLVTSIIAPLVLNPSDLLVSVEDKDDRVYIKVLVNEADLGRVLGRAGRTATAIRTIVYAASSKDGVRVMLEFDHN